VVDDTRYITGIYFLCGWGANQNIKILHYRQWLLGIRYGRNPRFLCTGLYVKYSRIVLGCGDGGAPQTLSLAKRRKAEGWKRVGSK